MERRSWITTFADPALLSDLRAAARAYHAEVDDCDPERCAHPEPMMMPVDLPNWIERQVLLERQRPVRFEKGHRPKSRNHEPLAATG